MAFVSLSLMRSLRGIRLVALFEGAKGALILLAGFGLLALVHRDLQDVADELVRRFHLNPARHYLRIFIEAAGKTTDTRLWLLAAGWCGPALRRVSIRRSLRPVARASLGRVVRRGHGCHLCAFGNRCVVAKYNVGQADHSHCQLGHCCVYDLDVVAIKG
jgi:hypothetical protein